MVTFLPAKDLPADRQREIWDLIGKVKAPRKARAKAPATARAEIERRGTVRLAGLDQLDGRKSAVCRVRFHYLSEGGEWLATDSAPMTYSAALALASEYHDVAAVVRADGSSYEPRNVPRGAKVRRVTFPSLMTDPVQEVKL